MPPIADARRGCDDLPARLVHNVRHRDQETNRAMCNPDTGFVDYDLEPSFFPSFNSADDAGCAACQSPLIVLIYR